RGAVEGRGADLGRRVQGGGGGSGTGSRGGGLVSLQVLGGGGGGFGGGGFGGGGGPMVFMMSGRALGGGGGGRGGRGMRGFDVNKPHGSIFYTYSGSVLNAAPYSLNGQPVSKADYNQNRFCVTLGGPLNIPHIYHGGTKTFLFGNYSGSRSSNPFDAFSTVPTLDQRNGIFGAQQVAISPIAAQLLPFIPQPNLPGTTRNFHFVSAAPSHTDTAFVR